MIGQLKEFLNRSLLAQVFLFMIFYWIIHTLCISVFFQGFLTNFHRWNFAGGNTSLAWLLEGSPFHSWSIVLRSLLNPFFLFALAGLYLPFYFRRKSIPLLEKPERIFLFVCAFLLTWEMITYDYNYFLGSAFWFDRIFLLLLCFAILRFPVLIPLFVACAFVYRAQFNFSIQGFPLFDKRILYDLLILYSVYQYVRMLFPGFSLKLLYWAMIIVASNYFFSGIDKLITTPHGYEWLTENDSADLFNNAVIRGWLACSGITTTDVLRGIIMEMGPYFQWTVLILEIGVLLIFWKRHIAIYWLGALCFMHIGIFIFGSMLFWKWMAVDILLLVLLIYHRRNYFAEMFPGKAHLFYTACVLIFSSLWLKPTSIAWHDTPYTQYFTYEVQDESGKWYPMDKNAMNPYHQYFQFDHFLFLVHDTLPEVSGFGYTSDYQLAEMLREPSIDFERVLREKGEVHFDSTMKLRYEEFIRSYFMNSNERLDKPLFITSVSLPHHLYSSVCGEQYNHDFRVMSFRVRINCEVSVGSHHMPAKSFIADEIVIYNGKDIPD